MEETKNLAREELAKINGEDKKAIDDRSIWDKVLGQRDSEMKKKPQQIANQHGRWQYNEKLRSQRKKKTDGSE